MSIEQRFKHATAYATRLARNQINEAEQALKPLGEHDPELPALMWGAYIGHIAGRLTVLVGRAEALTIIREVLSTYEAPHDH